MAEIAFFLNLKANVLNIKVPERKKHISLSFAARVVYNSKKIYSTISYGLLR